MAGHSRQLLAWMLREYTNRAIDADDQPYGRQLATLCEQVALTLRTKFGGRSLLIAARAPRSSATAKKPPSASQTSRVLHAYRLAYGVSDPTAEWLAAALGVPVSPGIERIIARVRDERRKAREWPSGPQYDLLVENDGTEHRIPVWPSNDLPGVQGVDTIPKQGD